MDTRFDVHHAKTAREFLEILTTGRGVFHPPNVAAGARWAYRGQGDSEWSLIAKALRKNAGLTHGLRAYSELHDLSRFFHRADQSGIDIPENSQALRQFLRDLDAKLTAKEQFRWPPPNLLSILAMAQHYGIPTRLLDWTTHPLIAAYFAAKDACNERAKNRNPTGKRLAVYGAIISFIEEWFDKDNAKDFTRGVVEVIRAPHAGNPNLHAQGGLFTLVRTDHLKWDDVEAPMPPEKANNFTVTALTLSWLDAPALLYLLSHLGVSAASVLPGFGGVVESLDEEKYWPKQFLYPRPQYYSDFWGPADDEPEPEQ